MRKFKFIGLSLLACSFLASCQKPEDKLPENPISEKPVESNNEQYKTLTIKNNAAKENTDTGVNALHVYTEGYNDNEDYLSGADVAKGTKVIAFVWTTQSDVDLKIESDDPSFKSITKTYNSYYMYESGSEYADKIEVEVTGNMTFTLDIHNYDAYPIKVLGDTSEITYRMVQTKGTGEDMIIEPIENNSIKPGYSLRTMFMNNTENEYELSATIGGYEFPLKTDEEKILLPNGQCGFLISNDVLDSIHSRITINIKKTKDNAVKKYNLIIDDTNDILSSNVFNSFDETVKEGKNDFYFYNGYDTSKYSKVTISLYVGDTLISTKELGPNLDYQSTDFLKVYVDADVKIVVEAIQKKKETYNVTVSNNEIDATFKLDDEVLGSTILEGTHKIDVISNVTGGYVCELYINDELIASSEFLEGTTSFDEKITGNLEIKIVKVTYNKLTIQNVDGIIFNYMQRDKNNNPSNVSSNGIINGYSLVAMVYNQNDQKYLMHISINGVKLEDREIKKSSEATQAMPYQAYLMLNSKQITGDIVISFDKASDEKNNVTILDTNSVIQQIYDTSTYQDLLTDTYLQPGTYSYELVLSYDGLSGDISIYVDDAQSPTKVIEFTSDDAGNTKNFDVEFKKSIKIIVTSY